jgi:phage terminase large subunit-like protein
VKKNTMLFNEQKAQDAVDFFQSMKLTKGKFHGCPFLLQPWQDKIVRDVYGTVKPDGNRQYKIVYIEITKKQGKSELAAVFGLKQLCADGEWMAEVYGCAADRQNASQVFDVAVEMVDQEPELKKVIKPILSQKRLVYLPTKSFYQVLSAEAYTKHGLNVSGCIFDELHAQPNRGLYDVMTFGSGDAREQPLYVFITTSGDDPDRTSIGWEVHEKAEQILLGNRIDPTFYPVIFGIDPDNQRIWTGWGYKTFKQLGISAKTFESKGWKNKKIWPLVNPSLGVTVKPEKLDEALTNVEGNEAEERKFKQLRLNIWVRHKSTKWVPYEIWEQNTGIVDPQRLKGRDCYGGFDLSSKRDLSAFALIFPPIEDDPKYSLLPTFWIPEDNVEEFVKKYGLKYREWIKMGLLKTTPGNTIDYKFIARDIYEQSQIYNIIEAAYDPTWNGDAVASELIESGMDINQLVEIKQNFTTLGPAMSEIEAFLHGKHINHGNNPILNWNYSNLEVIKNADGLVRPTKGIKKGNSKNKKGNEYYKIDGFVAVVNGFTRVILHKNNPTVYKTGKEIFSV